MQKLFLVLSLFCATSLSAQLVTTNPAAPTDDVAVTITFDATQGTGGLADCNCDVYIHTGVITNTSDEWQYVPTRWGEAVPEWKMDRVEGEANLYTYTFSPTLREYYGVPESETIEQIAMVFRNGDGSMEGKAGGGRDVFVDVSEGGNALGITATGDPDREYYALGRPLPVQLGATVPSNLEIYDNETLIASTRGVTLNTDVVFTTAGQHTVRFVATTEDGQVAEDSFDIRARLEVNFTSPEDNIIRIQPGATVTLTGTSFIESTLVLTTSTGVDFPDRNASTRTDEYRLDANEDVTTFTLTATYQGETAVDQVTFVTGEPQIAAPPADLQPGITDLPNGNIQLLLRAPGKNDVFVAHNFNDYNPTAGTRMKRSPDGGTFWVELSDLPAGEDLIFTYLIDGGIVQPDPYSTLVLDPFNDQFIDEETFPGIPEYPADKASGILTWHPRSRPTYEWQTAENYERPNQEKMVVYELLIRDFIAAHNFQTLTDTLDYLERLGVNAIELMPVSEFEGNLSWGYNPSFHMALDKYYGTPENFKAFVDECHARGMAVILDIVYNHAFGQSPLVRMWSVNGDNGAPQPTPDNPYVNVTPRHPFNVGYDFNHESALTKEYVKVTTKYWLEEFRIDGFRWDLTKGFTQRQSQDDALFSQYDEGRIAILKDYADHVWSIDDETYMIMEHLAARREENELAQYGNGMQFWTGFGIHDEYLEASMGYESNLSNIIEENYGFTDGGAMPYMESHDEQRMQYKNEQFGNMSGSYNVREQATGLDRIELASTFFYTVPGPKMLWQFGELGYDFPINYCTDGTENEGCRTGNKPIVWEYADDPNRQAVYNWIADLNFLRNNYEFFHGEVTASSLAGTMKYLNLRHPLETDQQAVIVGNFGVSSNAINNVFPEARTWYDYATGEALEVTNPARTFVLEPGEYRVYLSQNIERGGGNLGTSTNAITINRLHLEAFPNPTDGALTVSLALPLSTTLSIELLDVNGRTVKTLHRGQAGAGTNRFNVQTGKIPSGMYYLRVSDGVGVGVQKIVVH